MALMTEEATLLVEKGVCDLFELHNITLRPSDEEKEIVKDRDQRVLAEQTEALRKRKIEQLSQKIDIIMAGKRKKLLSKGVTDIQLDKQTLLQEEISKLPKLSPAHVLIHLPMEYYTNTGKNKISIDALNPSATTGDGAHRYKIFKDLWERGHHITSGSKFGCDYLLYPGDPVRFHATYMVKCLMGQTTPFTPAALVAFGRLSVAVNKLALLACCNTYGRIEYQTLQWHDNTT